MKFQKILAGLDCSSLGQVVFETALELAVLNQAELMLFHCLTADVVIGPPALAGELGLSPHLVNQAYQTEYIRLEQQTQQSQEWLQKCCELARQAGVQVKSEQVVANAGTAICQMAEAWGAQLIVLGRRGRKGLTEAILGSVSNHVLHHAPCAVLIVQGNSIPDSAVEVSNKAATLT